MTTGFARSNLVKSTSSTVVAMSSNVARNSITRGEPRRGKLIPHFLRPLAEYMFKL